MQYVTNKLETHMQVCSSVTCNESNQYHSCSMISSHCFLALIYHYLILITKKGDDNVIL